MSSKRGRKVNKDLPPSRARDVQRAFRARRAAHLEVCRTQHPPPTHRLMCMRQALEERVAVLEQENALLRATLKLPPSDRPVLGRGPTGKEKPKTFFGAEHPNHLMDTLRRSSVSTSSTETSTVSQPSRPYSNGDHSFQFPHWNNALMIHQEMAENNDSSPPVEGHPPPLKLSPISFYSQPSLPLRHTDSNGGVSPGPIHSRSNSYSHSSSSSSAGPDTFSPVYMMNEMPEHSPTVGYSPQNSTNSAHHHLCPPEPLSHFQYPLSSPSSAGATQQSSPYLTRRESDHLLNISYSRHSPQPRSLDHASSNGHRRAITEPQSLRALVTEYSGPRAELAASMSAHPIRVPSPPPVPLMDRDSVSRKYSLA